MKMRFNKKDFAFISIIVFLLITSLTLGISLAINLNSKKKTSFLEQYYNEHVSTFKVENANLSKGQIVFLGDSITDLYHLDDYYADLDKAAYNRGIGGDTTNGVIKRLQVSLYDIEPSEIVLMIGINDINGNKSKQSIIDNYQFILGDIKTHLPSSKLFAMSILPLNSTLGAVDVKKNNQTVVEINASIAQMASDYSYTYVDLYSHMIDENNELISSYSDDGIHPNSNGYQVWTDLLKPLL